MYSKKNRKRAVLHDLRWNTDEQASKHDGNRSDHWEAGLQPLFKGRIVWCFVYVVQQNSRDKQDDSSDVLQGAANWL
jgi:hypothetical protein